MVTGDDLPSQMEEDRESLNGDKSIVSTEEGSCSRSASTSAEEMWQDTRLKKEVDTEAEDGPQVTSATFPVLKRKMADKSPDLSNDPPDSENISSASNLTSSHSNLLNADLLHSLQYFALLRQNFPGGKFHFIWLLFLLIIGDNLSPRNRITAAIIICRF